MEHHDQFYIYKHEEITITIERLHDNIIKGKGSDYEDNILQNV